MSAHPPTGTRHAVSLPNRKTIRMQGWDFTSPGWYFITICAKNMRSVFGTVVGGRMVLNAAGRVADELWREIPEHFPRAIVDEHVVMPNHVHGLLSLTACRGTVENAAGREAMENAAGREALKLEAFGKPVAGSVPTIVRSYKAAVSRALGERLWQGRFYEVRARDEAARDNIRRYIRHNPENYDAVMNCSEPEFMGNHALLDMPKVGFLASRGQAALHGNLPIKPGEAIISGFLSPMERAVFRAGLKHKRPMIWVLPSGLGALYNRTACNSTLHSHTARNSTFHSHTARNGTFHSHTACNGTFHSHTACNGTFHSHTACRVAIDEGWLLVLSPFAQHLDAPNARRAAWCNQYVLAHCSRIVLGHLNPDGMLACILAEADPEKDVIRL